MLRTFAEATQNNLFQRIGATKFQHGIYGSQPGIIVRNNIFDEIAGAAIHQYTQAELRAGNGWEIHGNTFRKPMKYTWRTGGEY